MDETKIYGGMTKEEIEQYVLETHKVNLNTSTMTRDQMVGEAQQLDAEVAAEVADYTSDEPSDDAPVEEGEDEGDGEEGEDAPESATTDEAASVLANLGGLAEGMQEKRQEEIDAAFTAFLDTDPSREQFVSVMKGITITSGMLYTAIKAHH